MYDVKKTTKIKSLADAAFPILDQNLRRRTGLNVDIIKNWAYIVGKDISALCTPVKLIWGSRKNPPGAARLVIYAQPGIGVMLQHNSAKLIERINGFFGYYAVGELKITNFKRSGFSVAPAKKIDYDEEYNKVNLSRQEVKKIDSIVDKINDPYFKEALRKMGTYIYKNKYL